MCSQCWIPDLEYKSPYEDFSVYEDRIYEIFKNDFIAHNPTFQGLPVKVRRYAEEIDGKWAGFFHITSVEDHKTGERDVDLRRCERIRFPSPSISYSFNCPTCNYDTCEKPLIWKERQYGKNRIHILLKSEKYIIVLEPRPKAKMPYCMLITAYYLDRENSFKREIRRYETAAKEGRVIQ